MVIIHAIAILILILVLEFTPSLSMFWHEDKCLLKPSKAIFELAAQGLVRNIFDALKF